MRRWMYLLGIMSLLLTMSIVTAQETNARINDMWEDLNMRAEPTRSAEVVTKLAGRTPITVQERTQDNAWFRVSTADGTTGWVASGYVTLLSISEDEIPILGIEDTAPEPEPPPTESAPEPETAPEEAVSAPPPADVSDARINGRVNAGLLNLRAAPSTNAEILLELPDDTALILVRRTEDTDWLQAQLTDGTVGWVAAAYTRYSIDLETLPVGDADAPAPEAPADDAPVNDEAADEAPPVEAVPAGDAPFFRLGWRAPEIFARGQEMGNRADIFSKVGDSMTVEDVMYRPMGYNRYNLGAYGHLQATIDYFTQSYGRTDNSFNNASLAARGGWRTDIVLNPDFADKSVCEPQETPLACEYRLNKPAVALIALGGNDVANVPSEEYANNLRMITDYSIQQGVIPVLSTVPTRRGYEPEVAFYNQLIVQVADEYGVPLWDYSAAMQPLPNNGLGEDGLHPSIPPGEFAQAANFTGDNLQYGYVMRNLTALQALDVLRQNILQG